MQVTNTIEVILTWAESIFGSEQSYTIKAEL